jgi:LysM repeat protein
MSSHIVRRGDSLWSISRTELSDPRQWPQIATLNRLRKPYKLLIGQSLQLPERAPPGRRFAVPSATMAANAVEAQDKASILPGRAYLFVVVQEVAPGAKLVRKVIAVPETDISSMIVNSPELFGFQPRGPGAPTTLGEHALGDTLSKYISASNKPGGAPNFEGRAWYIDVGKLERAGIPVHSTDEIVRDLDRLAKLNPALGDRIAKLKSVIDKVEGEVLIEGRVPSSAVQSAEAAARELKILGAMSRGAKVLGVVGVVFTVYDLGSAGVESVQKNSVRPLAAEAVRQVGGWGGAWIGFKIGAAGGAAVGIETGPGALLSGLVGGLIFGYIGYKAGDAVANKISPR